MRAVLLLSALLCALPAAARPPDVPAAVQRIYDEMWEAARTGRVEEAHSHLDEATLYLRCDQAEGMLYLRTLMAD